MYQSLQAGRAAAAALVVLFHLGGTFASDKYFGFKAIDGVFGWADAGVEFFFVLSGFLITAAHRRDIGRPQALAPYVRKRLLRIYPTYWLICAMVCVAALAVPSLRQSLPSDAMTFVKGLALVPLDPAVVGGTGSPILFVAWSLQYEMLFYAVMAAFLVNRAAGLACAATVLLLHLGCRFGQGCGFPQSFVAGNFIFLFGIGVAAAYAAQSRLRLPRPLLVAVLALVGFVAFGAFEMWQGRDSLPVDRRLIYGAFSGIGILGMVRAEAAGDISLRQRWVALLGDASYSLYLLHIPVISVACKLLLALHPAGLPALLSAFGFVFLACIGAALAFYLLIERHMLRLFRRASHRSQRPDSPSAGVSAVSHHRSVGLP